MHVSGSSARSYCGAIYNHDNNSLCAATKAVFNILIFFSENTSRWHLIFCHYIPYIPGIHVICLNQIDTPPAAFLAELQKP